MTSTATVLQPSRLHSSALNPPYKSVAAKIGARALFTSIDWSRTSLGPIETWSQQLRTTTDIILANRYPMVVLWGSDLVCAAYNDAYATLIGSRHPGAMGVENKVTFPEVWHINEPIYEAVLREGREFYFEDALYPFERNDWLEEIYLTISYGPVRNESDAIGGVLVTLVETTRNVLSERRLRSLRDLASRTARIRSVAEIGSIAASVLAENAGDVIFALIFDADESDRMNRLDAAPRLIGRAGLAQTDADDLGSVASALFESGGSALVQLGASRSGAAYPGGAFGQSVRDAHVAALRRPGGGFALGWIVIGLSPALPRDDRYSEYLELIGSQIAVAFENATVFSRERRIADTLQRAALPGTLPELAGIVVDAVYEAGSDEARIGGDWYDAFALRDGRVVVSIGDVSGSGVVAAAAMGAARQMIRGLAQTLENPVDILDAVDRAFRIENESLIITAFVGILSADYRRLYYSSAGHPAPFVRDADGRIEALAAPDLPIGLRDAAIVTASEIVLEEGSMVVLYTDGLIEATRDPIAGELRLLAALSRDDFATAPRKALFLYEHVLEQRANDDVALLVIELRVPRTNDESGA